VDVPVYKCGVYPEGCNFHLCEACYHRYGKDSTISKAIKYVKIESDITNFHIFQRTSAKSQYFHLMNVTKNKSWVSKELNLRGSEGIDHAYWPKAVRLNDRLIYLIGGSENP
jgi:hypothetical protein